MATFNLTSAGGKLAAYLHYIWFDHAYLRLTRYNAHWISDELVRASQPWPYQVKAWRDQGIRTIVNLRGGVDSHTQLEAAACEKYGVKLVTYAVKSREAPTREQIMGAGPLFDSLEYPAMMHCKSGADRAGVMSVLYMHFRKGLPIREAVDQLHLRFGHFRVSQTGVLDFTFERYLEDAEPKGISFEDWVMSPAYDPPAIRKAFKAKWWGTLLGDHVLRRE